MKIVLSIIVYSIIVLFILSIKPSFLYDHEIKRYKTLGTGENQTLVSIELFLILSGIVSYVIAIFLHKKIAEWIKQSLELSQAQNEIPQMQLQNPGSLLPQSEIITAPESISETPMYGKGRTKVKSVSGFVPRSSIWKKAYT